MTTNTIDTLADDWDGPTDTDGAPCRFINHYTCADCGEEWEDQWSCGCNDDCPACGTTMTPHTTEEV